MDIQAQYGPLRAEIDAAIAGVLDSGRFILGPEGRALEASVSERLAGRPCVGVANGTDALVIALNALDIGPGDEVITTPYTFYATAEAIARVGATPVFADIDPSTYCLDPEAARAKIGPATRAILPVHIFGHPADMAAITALAREHGLAVVEDCAQAFGARAPEGEIATFGDVATFSFFPTKNFPGMGDGGMVVCRDGMIPAWWHAFSTPATFLKSPSASPRTSTPRSLYWLRADASRSVSSFKLTAWPSSVTCPV